MGVEGVLLLLPRRKGIGNEVPGRVGVGLAAAGRGCPLGVGSAPEARNGDPVGFSGKMGCASTGMENLGRVPHGSGLGDEDLKAR